MASFLPIIQIRLLECVPVAVWSTTSKASFVYKLRTGKADSPLHLVLPISSVSPLCRGLASSCFQRQQTQGPFLLPSPSLPSQSISLSGLLSPTSLQKLPPQRAFHSQTSQLHQYHPTTSSNRSIMFCRRWSGLPSDPEFPANITELGFVSSITNAWTCQGQQLISCSQLLHQQGR